ncbi:rod shape-determining protein MreD [Novosphingobium sp.]|uniref:rod shape-determining protein MreD n=1 Tax=Novosphingobium sp. TaxID=1874826 RepID=UPI00333EFE32
MATKARQPTTGLATARDATPRRPINRAPLPWLAAGLPWASIMALSLVTFSPVIASAPVIPPLALMALLAWRMLRPNLLPIWVGLPLGAWDDLFSGQPFGSAILLWSLAMLAMDVIDERFLWRGFVQDWAAAAALLTVYLVVAAGLAGLAARYPLPLTIGPQWLMTLVLFPAINRLIAGLDRVRLLPLQRL